ATDVLIVAGIASIQPHVVASFGIELAMLFIFGLGLTLFLGLWVAPRLMQQGWFERSIFTWGWSDRKSTRLNSSHVSISYAVCCPPPRPTFFPYTTLFRSLPPMY